MARPKTTDRISMNVLIDRDIAETLRAEKLGSISTVINEMCRLASGNGKICCPDCQVEFSVPAGRAALLKKQLNPQ